MIEISVGTEFTIDKKENGRHTLIDFMWVYFKEFGENFGRNSWLKEGWDALKNEIMKTQDSDKEIVGKAT